MGVEVESGDVLQPHWIVTWCNDVKLKREGHSSISSSHSFSRSPQGPLAETLGWGTLLWTLKDKYRTVQKPVWGPYRAWRGCQHYRPTALDSTADSGAYGRPTFTQVGLVQWVSSGLKSPSVTPLPFYPANHSPWCPPPRRWRHKSAGNPGYSIVLFLKWWWWWW